MRGTRLQIQIDPRKKLWLKEIVAFKVTVKCISKQIYLIILLFLSIVFCLGALTMTTDDKINT